MLTVATQSSAPPYFAVTAGPASHSPPPMALAPMTRPGPSLARMLRQVKIGASMSSPVSHRGIALVPGWGASSVCGLGAAAGLVGAVAVIAIGLYERRPRSARRGGLRVATYDGRLWPRNQPSARPIQHPSRKPRHSA